MPLTTDWDLVLLLTYKAVHGSSISTGAGNQTGPFPQTEIWARFFCLFSGREHAWGELRSAELSTSLQVSVFLFLCELSSPWASSQNDRWSWANWEGVSSYLSKAELCNNGPYLDARTDRISPHTSLLPSHTLPHPQKDPLSRISTSRSSQSLDQSSMICRQVVESNYCLLCDVIIPNVPCAGFIQENYVNKPRGAHWECWHAKESMVTVSCSRWTHLRWDRAPVKQKNPNTAHSEHVLMWARKACSAHLISAYGM